MIMPNGLLGAVREHLGLGNFPSRCTLMIHFDLNTFPRRFQNPLEAFALSNVTTLYIYIKSAVQRTKRIMPFPRALTRPSSPNSSRNSEPSSWEVNVAASQGRNASITTVSFQGLFRSLAAAQILMSQ